MSAPAPAPMTVDAFLEKAQSWEGGARYELIGGELVEMNAERNAHVWVKFDLAVELRRACRAVRPDAVVWTDGGAVIVDEHTLFEPDAMVQIGGAADPDAVVASEPMIVAEVMSPGTFRRDLGPKVSGYFRVPSIEHYLIVDIESRRVIHHARVGEAELRTRFVADGVLRLDPPGADLDVAAVFAAI